MFQLALSYCVLWAVLLVSSRGPVMVSGGGVEQTEYPFQCEGIHHMIGWNIVLLPSADSLNMSAGNRLFSLSCVNSVGFCSTVRWFFITVHPDRTVILPHVLWAPQLRQLQSGPLLSIPVHSEVAFKGILDGQERGIDWRDEFQPVASLRALVPEDDVVAWDFMRAGQVYSAAVLIFQHGCWGLDHLVLWRRSYTRRSMQLYLTEEARLHRQLYDRPEAKANPVENVSCIFLRAFPNKLL